MKQTNYHLFDFMDFDPALERDEALWKAYAPTAIVEREGDIVVTIPYQKQRHQADMAADDTTPQQHYDLVIRAYEPGIVRMFTSMAGDEMVEHDDMLVPAPAVKRLPLHLQPRADGLAGTDIIATDGTCRATIDLSEPRLDHWSDLQPAP